MKIEKNESIFLLYSFKEITTYLHFFPLFRENKNGTGLVESKVPLILYGQ